MFTEILRNQPLVLTTLTNVKHQLNIIDFDDDDSYIRLLIDAAAEVCEKYTNRLFSECTVTGEFPISQLSVRLPYSPIINITSVKIGDEDLTYSFNQFSDILTITDTTADPYSSATVIYTAGFTPSTIPNLVKHACNILVADFYKNRESETELSVNSIPLGATKLLDAYKLILL